MKEGFTNKEILIRILDKLDIIEKQVYLTNGKTRLHTKAIWGLFFVIIVIVGWFIKF